MGKTDLKTAWRPCSLRPSDATSFWRNSSYDRFWISIRFGMSMIFLMRPNERRKRRLLGTRETVAMDWLMFLLPRLLPELLQLDRATSFFELLLDGLGLGLRYALLDRLGRAVDQILGRLQAEPGELTDDLDDLDLFVAGAGEDDREVLLLGRGRARPAGPRRSGRRHRHGGRG